MISKRKKKRDSIKSKKKKETFENPFEVLYEACLDRLRD